MSWIRNTAKRYKSSVLFMDENICSKTFKFRKGPPYLLHAFNSGMILLIFYTGYGLSSLPCGLIWSRR
jgi:hypothetical protein